MQQRRLGRGHGEPMRLMIELEENHDLAELFALRDAAAAMICALLLSAASPQAPAQERPSGHRVTLWRWVGRCCARVENQRLGGGPHLMPAGGRLTVQQDSPGSPLDLLSSGSPVFDLARHRPRNK